MPFTPFHMGPGIFIKSLLQSGFSLMVFGWAQIVMDLQPLVVILRGQGQLHGVSHTYMGATLLGVVAALTGKYLSEFGLRILSIAKINPIKITWPVTIASAFIGTYSHVILDSIMHGDMEPFYPLSVENRLLEVLSYAELHQFCIYSGLFGAILYFLVQFTVAKHNL